MPLSRSASLSNAVQISNLVRDYLQQKEQIKPFVQDFFSLESTLQSAQHRQSFIPRNVLCDVIEQQYIAAGIQAPAELIDKLRLPTTFTVSTGHQLCLATGPLYMIVKILNTVKLANELNSKSNGIQVVPVFWMASEDHDFKEIDHFNVHQQHFSWYTEQDGAVGRMNTKGLSEVWDALEERIGHASFGPQALSLLREAYKTGSVAQSTRKLIHQLLREFPVIIIDGDDAALKQYFSPVMREELQSQITETALLKSSDLLRKLGYNRQINPRSINLFYLKDDSRKRIDFSEDRYRLVDSPITWTASEILAELKEFPERFSPNVAMRPLYQELLLPNLAYVGGAGEIAYWLQLKEVFNAFNLPFPLLVLRNSIFLLEPSSNKKLQKLEFDALELLNEENKVVDSWIKRGFHPDLSDEKNTLNLLFTTIAQKIKKVDASLEAAAMAEHKKQADALENLEKRMLKSMKLAEEQNLNQLRKIRSRLLPGNVFMERNDNLFSWYSDYGPSILQQIYDSISPESAMLHILVPSESADK
jgi:bacillithiol biosynthesis cysteine-adding enzyme BshC